MAGRRALTEAVFIDNDDDSDETPIDMNNMRDDDDPHMRAVAYAMGQEDDDYYPEDEDQEADEGEGMPADSDVDDIDFANFKGIYFNDDPNRKYQCPETGAHFEYHDLCKRMLQLKHLRKQIDKELGLKVADTPLQDEKENARKQEQAKKGKGEEQSQQQKRQLTSNV